METSFGECLRRLRIRAGFGLREFAGLVGIATSNLSAIEHGRRCPPADSARLRDIANALGLVEGDDDWNLFFDSASRPGDVPADVRKTVQRKLVPVLLRTIENKQLSDSDIERLIQEIEGRHERDEPPENTSTSI
ncbi:MAG: helix-turn-helix transcriptional regulator [Planctomycetaceae bacterium]|nr:helix-turn-helix transcriptional regulator [Planctomycetaceae bacterium]